MQVPENPRALLRRLILFEHNELAGLFIVSSQRRVNFHFNFLLEKMKTGGNEEFEIFPRLDHYVKTLQSV